MNTPTFDGRVPDFTARIVGSRRLKNSPAGNGRFDVLFDNHAVHQTQTNSAVSYDVENFRGDQYRPGPLCAVWLSKGGKIVAMTRVSA